MLNLRRIQLSAATLALFLVATTCSADVKLPALLSDHMVLQRDEPVPIWGWAEPGEKVIVAIAGQTHETEANEAGRWRVDLTPLSVGDPLTLVVEGNNRLQRTDILVGEVWVCSGQSNMQFALGASRGASLELLRANHPELRLITVNPQGSQTPLEDFEGQWQSCTPGVAKDFSAVGYFFGLQLQQTLNVPIGLIDNAWGGSACEAWIRRDLLEGDSIYQLLMERWEEKEARYESGAAQDSYEKVLAKWEQNKTDGKNPGRKPASPDIAMRGQHRPANLYNARVLPLVPYAIGGAIWYQGESNASRAYQYREMFPLMIQNWRDDWGQGDFPFYWVQLADFRAEKSEPGESAWAELREAQTMTLDRLKNTGEAVIIDIGEGKDIHPRNKVVVGQRLARWALAKQYGIDIAYQSPSYNSMEKRDDAVVLSFDHVDGGWRPFDVKTPVGFAVAGADKRFVWADARVIEGQRIEVSSSEISDPVAVRYAWADNPVCNMFNGMGLPLTPFRTDDWPGGTINNR